MSDSAERAASTAHARILVVEDEQIVGLELRDRLTSMGHSVLAVVGSGEEAIEQAGRLRPDLLLMDVKLQGEMDGIQAAQTIQGAVDVPIIYVTAFADQATLARAMVTEPYGYILKPFQERELHVVIEVALYRHRIQRRQRFMARASGEVAASLDRETILRKTAALIAEEFADWCVIHLRGRDATLRLAAFAHRDSQRSQLARPSAGAVLAGPDARRIHDVVSTGHPLFASELTGDQGSRGLLGLARSLVPGLTIASLVSVALISGGDTIGTLTVVSEGPERSLAEDDVGVLEELGRRLAAGLENTRLYAEAQLATRLREEILAIVSHDLKNPLASIILNADLLLRGPGPNTTERATRSALKIRGAAESMARLTDDLLDMARLDSGRLALEIERVDAHELLAEALEMFEAAASEHAIDLSIVALPDVKVSCDRQRVLQVLSNLIGNALKLSADGCSITVHGTVSGSSLLLSVSDEAGGIPPEDREHIFERFRQGANAGRRGTGLGLYIAKGLVEAQGGHIWFASTPGVGTTFYFTIPLAESVEAPAPLP